MSTPAILLSDLHLNARPRAAMVAALETVLSRHPEADLVLNGDIFELSSFPAGRQLASALEAILAENSRFPELLRRHLARGRRVTFVAGNHDAGIVQLSEALTSALAEGQRRPEVAPWFVRLGPVHVEHGHVYDPDNAPLHPLADFHAECEPLGAALMRRFITHAGALEFAHAHETTPVQGILRAFRLYGPRAPGLIARYFGTAFAMCWEAATRRGSERATARAEGESRLLELVERQALDIGSVAALLEATAEPTHARFTPLFARLYFDAILVGLLGSAALARLVVLPSAPALGAAALAASYLAGLRPDRRYRDRPCRDLRDAAREVARITGASRVVFGHTHVEEDDGPYFNLGSFTYSQGPRRYALVSRDGRVERALV